MRKTLLLIALLSFITGYAAVDDNVVINDRTVNYRLKSSKGQLSSVKIEDVTEYVANRVDEKIYATTVYGDGIKINRASAPDSKPIYRSWEDDDLFFTGSRICALPVNLKKRNPAKVTFERTMTQPEQFTDIMLLKPGYTIHSTTFNIYVPGDIADKMVFTPHNFPEGATLEKTAAKNGDLVYTVTLKDIPALKRESLSASAETYTPRIEASGYFKDTDDLYQYFYSKLSCEEPTENVTSLAKSLCEGMSDVQDKIDTIATWVRNNIRYVAIEHGEYGMQPDAAASVLEKRFGDCKGSANLIRMMLRSVGIDGRLVWIGTEGDVTGSWTERPSLAAGNHMIAAAILPDTVIFLDGTTTNAPKGMIPPSIAGQECLIENGDRCIVGYVPQQSPDENKLVLNGELSFGPNGLDGKYKAEFCGVERMAIENSLAGMNAPRRKSLLQLILAFDRKGVVSPDPVASTASVNAPVTTVTYSETDPSALRTLSSGKTYLQMRPLRAVSYPRLDEKNRRGPIDLGRKDKVETHFSCDIPDDYSVEKVPELMKVSSPWFEGFVEYCFDKENNKIICNAVLECVKTTGGVEDVSLWNKSLKEIETISSTPVILTKMSKEE